MFNRFSEKLVTASGGGSGIPGGTAGQALVKVDGADYNYTWATVVIGTGSGVPPGGLTGQHLAKQSGADGDVIWEDPPAVDLSNYAYLPGRSGGQLLKGGTNDDETLILQGTAGESTATADAVIVKVGIDGADTALKVRGDGAVTIGGDYHPYGAKFSVTGMSAVTAGDGEIGFLVNSTDVIAGGFFNLSHNVVNIGHIGTQAAEVGAGGMLKIYKQQSMAGFDNRTGMIEMHDSPFGSGNRDNISVILSIDSIRRMSFYPRIPDGTLDAAYYFDTKFALTDPATKLFSLRNNAVDKFWVGPTGLIFSAGVPDYANEAAAISGGLITGNIYRTGGDLKIVT